MCVRVHTCPCTPTGCASVKRDLNVYKRDLNVYKTDLNTRKRDLFTCVYVCIHVHVHPYGVRVSKET